MINPFSTKIRVALRNARKDERLKTQQEATRDKRIALKTLEAEKDLEIAELESELHSIAMKMEFYQDQYEKMLTESQKTKIDKKKNAKLANDIYFLIKEYVKSESTLVSKIGMIMSEAGIKLIEK